MRRCSFRRINRSCALSVPRTTCKPCRRCRMCAFAAVVAVERASALRRPRSRRPVRSLETTDTAQRLRTRATRLFRNGTLLPDGLSGFNSISTTIDMPWRCPACGTVIEHRETEMRPSRGALYRCHVCRLELAFDLITERLIATAPRSDEPDTKERDLK
jgi:predicted RNA-binding Zn-ribbon protein involved in translation (DUF1610 family)